MYTQGSPAQSPNKASPLKLKAEEMEVDDSNSRQGTSPLLTSLLKSPSAAPNPSSTPILHSTIGNTSVSQVRVAAPTITNLLTGSAANISGSHTNTVQVTTLKMIASPNASITSQFPSQLQSQPLTGPPPSDQSLTTVPQSPSQAAPTLSMLLENKSKENQQKTTIAGAETQQTSLSTQQTKHTTFADNVEKPAVESEIGAVDSPIKDEEQQLMEVFNGLIPDNIDELADILTENNAIILNPELLEEESILDSVDDLIDDTAAADSDTANKDVKPSENSLIQAKNISISTEVALIRDEENKESVETTSENPTIAEEPVDVKTESDESKEVRLYNPHICFLRKRIQMLLNDHFLGGGVLSFTG